MWLSSGDIILYFAQSVIFGVFSGAFYDCFRILRIALDTANMNGRAGKRADFIICFICDIIYFTVFSAAYCVFVYLAFDGRFRLGSLASALAGFFAYYFTLGKLVMKISDFIITQIRRAVMFVLRYTALPVFRLGKRIFSRLSRLLNIIKGK